MIDVFVWEVFCLAVAAPLFYFPDRFPVAGQVTGLLLLAGGWMVRRRRLGVWFVRTPADWPLWFWLLVSLPVAVIVAPAGLREELSLPRAWILVWNFGLFLFVVTYVGRTSRLRHLLGGGFVGLGTLVAGAAIFGTNWSSKFPSLSFVLERLPTPLVGVFAGAEGGFSPNQLAGTLLYVLPFAVMVLAAELSNRRRFFIWLPLLMAVVVMGVVFLASQSRAGYIGLAASAALLLLGPRRWGRRLLAGAMGLGVVVLLLLPVPELLAAFDSGTRFDAMQGGVNMAGRLEIWRSAVYGITDFPLTGMGLGVFRKIGPLLYPLVVIRPTYDIAHAHNFFLQTGLDFGIPGLVAILAVYVLCVWQGIALWRSNSFEGSRYWALGLLAALIGQAVYSLADAVAMGSKTNLAAWFLWALLLRLGSLGAETGNATVHSA